MLRMQSHVSNLLKFSPCFIFPKRLKSSRNKVRSEGLDDDELNPFLKPSKSSKEPEYSSTSTDIITLLHKKHTWADIKRYFKNWKSNQVIMDQRYLEERHQCLGPDIAATHFIIYRNGRVKFHGKKDWITIDDFKTRKVPSSYVPNIHVAVIDASDTLLCYEGLENFVGLNRMKQLILRNCTLLDDWCLHRISNLLENSLIYLDISGCHQVTERGICCLYQLKNLETLVINDCPKIANKELTSLMLQEILPKCNVIGVDYSKISLEEQSESK